MDYSAKIENLSTFGHGTVALWYVITLFVGLLHMGWRLFVFFPWWIFIASFLYFLGIAFRARFVEFFSAISKVYALFVVLIYWAAIYPTHNPWHNATDTYLVISVHIFSPLIILIQTFRARNTHRTTYKQRNDDFPVATSFIINTVIYFLYLGFYLLILPRYGEPVYKSAGFTMDERRDALVAFLGWIIVLAVNSFYALVTWYFQRKEQQLKIKEFERNTRHPFTSAEERNFVRVDY